MGTIDLTQKDLCKTCKHYWVDFPTPLDHYEPHCEIIDEKYNFSAEKFAELVPFPCLECPFKCYIKKK